MKETRWLKARDGVVCEVVCQFHWDQRQIFPFSSNSSDLFNNHQAGYSQAATYNKLQRKQKGTTPGCKPSFIRLPHSWFTVDSPQLSSSRHTLPICPTPCHRHAFKTFRLHLAVHKACPTRSSKIGVCLLPSSSTYSVQS